MKILKVVTTGGRFYDQRDVVFTCLDYFKSLADSHSQYTEIEILHGACTIDGELSGADKLSQEWAISRQVPYKGIPAKWDQFGKRAGPMRNLVLINEKPDFVLAFPGNFGTADCVHKADSRDIPVVHASALFERLRKSEKR